MRRASGRAPFNFICRLSQLRRPRSRSTHLLNRFQPAGILLYFRLPDHTSIPAMAPYPRRRAILSRATSLAGAGGSFGAAPPAPSASWRRDPRSCRAACKRPFGEGARGLLGFELFLEFDEPFFERLPLGVHRLGLLGKSALQPSRSFCSARCNAASLASNALQRARLTADRSSAARDAPLDFRMLRACSEG